MGIFRFAFFVLLVAAMVSLAASLFGTAATAGLAALGAVLFLPVLLFKVLFVFMIFGFLARTACGWNRHGEWRRSHPRSRRTAPERPSAEERFEEWHRMAHAREEVDSWTPEV